MSTRVEEIGISKNIRPRDEISFGPHQSVNGTFLTTTGIEDMEGLRQRIPFRIGDAEDDEDTVLDEQRKNKTLFSVIVALNFD